MPEIKTRETVKDIKILDKASVAGERMKQAFIRSKDTAQNLMDDGQVSPSEYAEDKIRYAAEDVVHDTGHAIRKETDKAVDKGRRAFREHRREKRLERQEKKVDDAARRYEQRTEHNVSQAAHQTRSSVRAKDTTIKTAQRSEHTIKQTAKSTGKATVKTANASVKSTQKAVKTAEKTSKAAIKTAEETAKATKKAAEVAAKTAQKAAIAAKQAAIAAYKAAVAVGKAIVAAVKAIIAAIKELIAAIAAGGWVAVVVILVICLVALIVGSCFGIFFSSEDTGTNMTMQQVVRDINEDYQNRIETIKANNPYDDLEMSGSRAVWPQVLSIYAVKTTTDPDNAMEVATMTEEKKQLLTDIFWAMNSISYRTETETETQIVESDDGHGNILEEEVEVTHTTLYIDFDARTIRINKTFSQHHGKDIVSTPKTESSVRKVSIPDFLCDELKEYLALLYNNDPDERIFKCTKSTLTKHFRNYTELAGLKPITIHGLRHSHVSLLISKRYDIFEVSKRIGHKSVKTTQDTYGHLFDEVQKSIANDLDGMRRR